MTEANTNQDADPEKLIGKTIKIVNLATRQDLNGHFGKVQTYKADSQRYTVQLASISPAALAAAARAGQSAPQAQTFDFKAQNLVAATFVDQMNSKLQTMKSLFQSLIADPVIREQVRKAYITFQAKLPPGVKPEYAGAAVLILTFLLIRMIGVTKFFMMFSLIGMVLLVSMPDIAAGADAKTCLRNFPSRWRETLVQSTGFTNISEKVALIGLGFVILFSVKILLTPTASGGSTSGGRKPLTSSVDSSTSWKPTPELWKGFETAEDIYQLGFEDATAGKDFGASLPGDADTVKLSFGTSSSPVSTDPSSTTYDDWDSYESTPPPPPQKSRFGVGTIFSIVSLMRMVKELAFTPDNRPDLQLFIVNLKRMEPWRLGLVGLCLYQIISSLLF